MQIPSKTGASENMGGIHCPPGIVHDSHVNGESKSINYPINASMKQENNELELSNGSQQQIKNYHYLKYQYDHVFVIGDNKLKHNVEVMIGKQTLYCSLHDTRNGEQECDHIRFTKMFEGIQN
jgi:hypothetical protein